MGDSKSYQSMLQNAEKQAKNTAKEVEGASKRIENLGTSLMGFGARMKLFVTAPLVGLGVILAKTASDAEETGSKFSVTFSSVEKQANQMVRTLDQSYGLADITARKLMSDTGDLLSGFGFTQAAAADLSFRVQKLAVDLASFTNVEGGAERASQALTRGLLGEREMMKMLGIAILEKDVKERMAINAAKGLRYENERMAKAYATLDIAIEQSKNSVGDYARTSKSLANQSRELWEDIKDLRVEFGKLLVPIGSALVSAFRSAVDSMRNMGSAGKILILSLGGALASIGPLAFALGTLVWSYTQLITAIKAATAAQLAFATSAGIVVAAIAAAVTVYKLAYDATRLYYTQMDLETQKMKEEARQMKARNVLLREEIQLREGMYPELRRERAEARTEAFKASAQQNVERARKQYEEAKARLGGKGEGHVWWYDWKVGLVEAAKKRLAEATAAAAGPGKSKLFETLPQLDTEREIVHRIQQKIAGREFTDAQLAAINMDRVENWQNWQQQFGHAAGAMGMLPGAMGGRLASLFGATRQGLGASLNAMFFGGGAAPMGPRGIQSFVGQREAVGARSVEASQRRAQTLTQLKHAEEQIRQEKERKRREEISQKKLEENTTGLGTLGDIINRWISSGMTGGNGLNINPADFS